MKKGRDDVFKCSICGRFISYDDIFTGDAKGKYGKTIDTAMEIVEYWHTKCEKKESEMKEQIKMKFKDAPVGARFKYPNMETIWIKLNSFPKGDGLICTWNGNVEGYQAFCSFVDEEKGIDFDTEIELL